jgi:hypothetical protein
MGELLLGCSGWNYGDTSEKGGWVGVFYPDKDTKRLCRRLNHVPMKLSLLRIVFLNLDSYQRHD